MLRKHRAIVIPKPVYYVCAQLQNAGFAAFVVGGAVRDALLGAEAHDWDIATDALPQTVRELFAATIPTGEKFGTITVQLDAMDIEVTTFREELEYHDGRHPHQVRYSPSILQDLSRRDFTVNAIAYDPLKKQFIDPFAGRRDIGRRRLRCVGTPEERFREDALRMLRLIRFSSTLGFRPVRNALAAVNPEWIRRVSWERIQSEISGLVLGRHADYGLRLLYKTELMLETLPELAACSGIPQGNRHQWDVLGHSIMAVQRISPQLHLRLAALCHDLGKAPTMKDTADRVRFPEHDRQGSLLARQMLARLRYSKALTDKVAHLVRWHMFQIGPHASERAIRRFIARVGPEHIDDLIELRRADILAMRFHPRQAAAYYHGLQQRIQAVRAQTNALDIHGLDVDGHELMKHFNLRPGPLIGRVLDHLLYLVLDNPSMNQKQELLKQAAAYLQKHDHSREESRPE